MTDFTEDRQWIADWRDGMFSSTSRDSEGWPIEMYGVVSSWEAMMARLEKAEATLKTLRQWDMLDACADGPWAKKLIDDTLGVECAHANTHFDRSLCACGSMHHYCDDCGEQMEGCAWGQ